MFGCRNINVFDYRVRFPRHLWDWQTLWALSDDPRI